ncbi:DNA repair protein RadC [Cupriavidus sp. CuC1]|uniref:RadC family protein n=1 Tax=Cupriavidus sp. CuC1 TaxID=3373131 RepID=UPI0037D2BBDA
MRITDWPSNERPREKLLSGGAATLSDAELLAVFLRVGVAGKSAIDIARELLNDFGTLSGLFAADAGQLARVKGVGGAKYAQLQAARELTRRALGEQLQLPGALDSPTAVRDYLRLSLAGLGHEVFLCLFLDARNRLLASEELFRGTLTQTSVYPREVARKALTHNAAAVIVAHNHPSGNTTPSAADLAMTRALTRSLALIDVQVLDHFIVAGSNIHSFAEHGQL